jgi:hypothetical protein
MKLKKNNKKNIKDFILSEDAKISKKALLVGWLWLSVWLLWWVAEAWHSSSPCGWSHSSSIGSTNHSSAISHASHSSY